MSEFHTSIISKLIKGEEDTSKDKLYLPPTDNLTVCAVYYC